MVFLKLSNFETKSATNRTFARIGVWDLNFQFVKSHRIVDVSFFLNSPWYYAKRLLVDIINLILSESLISGKPPILWFWLLKYTAN